MISFNMTTKDNFASFTDPANNLSVFIDSFDNVEFNVRIGSLLSSDFIDTIKAENNFELNTKLDKLFKEVLKQ